MAYDYLPPDGALSRLYKNEAFIEFLRVVLDQPVLFRLEDPFGACSINLFKPGKYWPMKVIAHDLLSTYTIRMHDQRMGS